MRSRQTTSFWLVVPPNTAYGRKPEHWYVEDLTARRALYENETAARSAVHFGGTRPTKKLAGEIALGVWQDFRTK